MESTKRNKWNSSLFTDFSLNWKVQWQIVSYQYSGLKSMLNITKIFHMSWSIVSWKIWHSKFSTSPRMSHHQTNQMLPCSIACPLTLQQYMIKMLYLVDNITRQKSHNSFLLVNSHQSPANASVTDVVLLTAVYNLFQVLHIPVWHDKIWGLYSLLRKLWFFLYCFLWTKFFNIEEIYLKCIKPSHEQGLVYTIKLVLQ